MLAHCTGFSVQHPDRKPPAYQTCVNRSVLLLVASASSLRAPCFIGAVCGSAFQASCSGMEAEETMGCIQEFPDHYKVMMDRLNEQRELDQFTDITLIVDGHQFKAHKAVLAACSHFFYKFFQDFTEEPLVEIEGVSNVAFRHLIEFTYTAKLMLQGEEEASDIYKAAEYLQMHEAIKALEFRNKETIVIEEKPQDEENLKKWRISDTNSVITEAMTNSDDEGEPVEIEVEITEGTIELEENLETLEAGTSPEQSVKYIQSTGTSDDSALALLADITSKYRQGERKRQLQEDSANESDAAGNQVEGIEIMEVHLSHVNSMFPCQKCNRSFKLFYHLKEHMKSHSEDNFKCEICNKSYVREIAWKQHLTCYHLEESAACRRPRPGKKIHVCQYCDKQFDHFGHFKEHLRKHTGEKPFQCPNCHEHFARNSTLKCHLTACQHGVGAKKGRKKLYECQVCDSVFNCWDQFKDHLVLHTGDKPNHCTLCDMWFMQGSELRKHLRDTHNIAERIVTEVVLPSEQTEAEAVSSMAFVEHVEQVHVVPVDQVIQVQVDPPQLTVGHLHQDLLEVNQVKGAHILDLQTQVHMGHIEVEHLQIDPGTEVHVEEVHVEHVNEIHMEEVEAQLLDESSIQHIEHTIEDQSCQAEVAEYHQIVHTGADNIQIRQIEMTHIEAAAE
ncbi:zinc finger protein 131 isoform X2 [Bufo bufo]|uniref:zinc finger protein 131 isoform X2 n=1 Tax=Bufo bufo TaxID=8384 RepID=UPI001ABDC5AE|nr:zinc finger protein 131 isoform X2 [Bufo bufo]